MASCTEDIVADAEKPAIIQQSAYLSPYIDNCLQISFLRVSSSMVTKVWDCAALDPNGTVVMAVVKDYTANVVGELLRWAAGVICAVGRSKTIRSNA